MDKHSYPKYRGTFDDRDCGKGCAMLALAFIAIGVAIFFLAGAGIDKSIDNQNRMLCSSAQVSGNTDWLAKCDRFYNTGAIEYLR